MDLRRAQIDSLLDFAPTMRMETPGDESAWFLPIGDVTGKVLFKIRVVLPRDFPWVAPEIWTQPTVQSHWINQTNGRVQGHPKLMRWNTNYKLGEILAEVLTHLGVPHPPRAAPSQPLLPSQAPPAYPSAPAPEKRSFMSKLMSVGDRIDNYFSRPATPPAAAPAPSAAPSIYAAVSAPPVEPAPAPAKSAPAEAKPAPSVVEESIAPQFKSLDSLSKAEKLAIAKDLDKRELFVLGTIEVAEQKAFLESIDQASFSLASDTIKRKEQVETLTGKYRNNLETYRNLMEQTKQVREPELTHAEARKLLNELATREEVASSKLVAAFHEERPGGVLRSKKDIAAFREAYVTARQSMHRSKAMQQRIAFQQEALKPHQ